MLELSEGNDSLCLTSLRRPAIYDDLTDMSSALVIVSFCEHCDLCWSVMTLLLSVPFQQNCNNNITMTNALLIVSSSTVN